MQRCECCSNRPVAGSALINTQCTEVARERRAGGSGVPLAPALPTVTPSATPLRLPATCRIGCCRRNTHETMGVELLWLQKAVMQAVLRLTVLLWQRCLGTRRVSRAGCWRRWPEPQPHPQPQARVQAQSEAQAMVELVGGAARGWSSWVEHRGAVCSCNLRMGGSCGRLHGGVEAVALCWHSLQRFAMGLLARCVVSQLHARRGGGAHGCCCMQRC